MQVIRMNILQPPDREQEKFKSENATVPFIRPPIARQSRKRRERMTNAGGKQTHRWTPWIPTYLFVASRPRTSAGEALSFPRVRRVWDRSLGMEVNAPRRLRGQMPRGEWRRTGRRTRGRRRFHPGVNRGNWRRAGIDSETQPSFPLGSRQNSNLYSASDKMARGNYLPLAEPFRPLGRAAPPFERRSLSLSDYVNGFKGSLVGS